MSSLYPPRSLVGGVSCFSDGNRPPGLLGAGRIGPGVSQATCRQTNRMTHDTGITGGDMEPIGNLLDALGVMHTPDDGELVASAVVLLKVLDNDGDVSLRIVCSDGLSWIERLGMLRAAEHVELPAASETVE